MTTGRAEPIAEPLHPARAATSTAPRGRPRASYPPVERWDDWEEYDPKAWPQKVKRRYALIPTICFNCEAALRAARLRRQADRSQIQKFEGNPVHPGQPRPQLRQGPGHAQPGARTRSASAIRCERAGARGGGQVGARDVGRGARRHRRAHPQGARRGPAEGGHVPRRPAGPRARLPAARLPRLGHRRPQQPHQRLLGRRARRLRVLARARPARRPITPTRASSCCCPRTSRPATTSIRTPSGSSRARCAAPRSA